MAETLTYDPTPADAPELNADEQDSLAVGEEMQEAQDQLLAGKYKNAQDLESAYLELQKKLGTGDTEPETTRVEEPESDEPSTISFLNDASSEYSENGELSAETMSKLTEMSSEELVKAYIENQGNQESATLTDAQVSSIKAKAGGDTQYETIVTWASENLEASSIEGFDTLIETGNTKAIEFAVAGLKAMYEAQNGSEGKMVTGKAPRTDGETFKSQAEVVAAMADPRYDRDPAYRDEIVNKLERSNVNF